MRERERVKSTRVITATDSAGKAVVLESAPLVPTINGPDAEVVNLWRVDPGDQIPDVAAPPGPLPDVNAIQPGEVQVFRYTIPGHTEIHDGGESTDFNGSQPGMHWTESIDIQICLDGEMTLLLPDSTTVLAAGDTVVLHGQEHGWANRSDNPATMLVILVGARRRSE